jgi:hypothetical protein
MEFEVYVSSVRFIIDTDNADSAVDDVYEILGNTAYDWGTVSVA